MVILGISMIIVSQYIFKFRKTNNVTKTRALLQTTGCKDEPNVNKTRALLQTTGCKDEPNVNKT
jgi:hypothetical protein